MRGSAKDVTKDDRIRYASGMLQKEVLPHVGNRNRYLIIDNCRGMKHGEYGKLDDDGLVQPEPEFLGMTSSSERQPL